MVPEALAALPCSGDKEASLARRRAKLEQTGIKTIVMHLKDTDPSQDIRERAITASNRFIPLLDEPP